MLCQVQARGTRQWRGSGLGDRLAAHLSLFDLLLLLFQEGRGDACDVLLGTEQQGPQVFHELSGVLSVQEARQVNLHHLAVRVLQHTHEGGEESMQHVNMGRELVEWRGGGG